MLALAFAIAVNHWSHWLQFSTLLVVCVNEMVPIAVRGASRRAGLAAAAGFAVAAFLSTIQP
jgi:hypothetical protein